MPRYLAAGTIGLLLLAVLAFWPTYLSQPWAPVDRYTHLHAAVGLLWILLLLAQTLLMLGGKRQLHRSLGRLAYVLAPSFVLASVLLAHHRFSRMDAATFGREAYTLYLPLSAALLFALASSLALRHRRVAAVHARFMACTALLFVDPVLGRFLAFHGVQLAAFWHYQLVTFGIELVVLFALWRTLAATTPARGAFLRFSLVYAALLLLWFAVPGSRSWAAFADWFRGLPIT